MLRIPPMQRLTGPALHPLPSPTADRVCSSRVGFRVMTSLMERRIRRSLLCVVLAGAAGCGGDDFENAPRPAVPLELTGVIQESAVSVQPDRAGAGPFEITITNQTDEAHAVVLDHHLRDRMYVVGDTLTVADFALSCTLPYAERAQIPLEGFESIGRWHKRLAAIDAWREAFP